MKNFIIGIIAITLFSCSSTESSLHNRYYSKNRGASLSIKTDSTFLIQDRKSMYISNGSVMGKFKKVSKNKICIYDLVDRMNLPIEIKPLGENENKNFNIIIDATQYLMLDYSKIAVYIVSNSGEKTFLGKLHNNKNYFFSELLNDRESTDFKLLFKYDKSKGSVYMSKYDIAETQPININQGDKVIYIDFNILYFDLKGLDELSNNRCYKLSQDRFLPIRTQNGS